METAVQGLTAADIGMIKSIVTALAGQDFPTIINQVATIGNALQLHEQNVQGLQAQLATHQQHMGIIQGEMQRMQHEQSMAGAPAGREGGSFESWGKPILEYRCWADVDKLNNDRAKSRDWKVRFKDAMKQSSKAADWRVILAFVEGQGESSRA